MNNNKLGEKLVAFERAVYPDPHTGGGSGGAGGCGGSGGCGGGGGCSGGSGGCRGNAVNPQ